MRLGHLQLLRRAANAFLASLAGTGDANDLALKRVLAAGDLDAVLLFQLGHQRVAVEAVGHLGDDEVMSDIDSTVAFAKAAENPTISSGWTDTVWNQ